jgi:HlyD family secretion protein
MKKSWKIILTLVLLLVVIIVFGEKFGSKGDALEVEVESSARRDLVETVSASGKIQPEIEVKIQSEVSGQILELPVKEGDYVLKGQLLVKINPDLYTSALNRAEAAVNGARSNLSSARARLAQAEAQFKANDLSYQRQKKLFEDAVISKSELETITSQWETSRAEVTAAKESIESAGFSISSAEAGRLEALDNLKRTTILSPMNGTVTALTKEIGEAVLGNNMMSGEIIMKISALSSMEVNVEVNESDIVRVTKGDTAVVEVDAFKDEKFKGIVTEISNTALNSLTAMAATNEVTNFSVKIKILPESYTHLKDGTDANQSPFRPGMSATVEIETEKINGALTIPIKCVTSRDDTTSASLLERLKKKDETSAVVQETEEPFTVVFVMNDQTSKCELRVVKTGIQNDKYISITEGIKDGEKVITGPYEMVSRKLKNHDSITIKKEKEEEVKESDK